MPPADQMMNIRNEMMQTMIECGLDVEAQHHEVATGRPERNRHAVRRRWSQMADKMMIYKYIIKNVATQAQQDGHLHAQAALRRQRLGHAHPHLAVEGGQAAVRRLAATRA